MPQHTDNRLNPRKSILARVIMAGLVLYVVSVGPFVSLALVHHELAPMVNIVYRPLLDYSIRGFIRPYIFWCSEKMGVPTPQDDRPH